MRRSRTGEITGLDIQPGRIVAAVAAAPGSAQVARAAGAPIEASVVRAGEVADPATLAAHLKRLFAAHRLPPRVRVGLSHPRAVMRVVDLPPLEDPADIAAALKIQAAEHIAMPVSQAVMDHQVVGIVETPEGRRTRVIAVAAQRDSVLTLLAALRRAGLRPEGIDLSAFALVRALHGARGDEPVLYAQVGGTTTLAVARGTRCELTRVAPVDLERLAQLLAERQGIVLDAATERLLAFRPDGGDQAALAVLDQGLAELADEIRNTMEFFAAQGDGTPVAEVVLSGPAAAIPNFGTVLEQRVGAAVRCVAAVEARPGALGAVDPFHAPIAAGLAIEERAA
jgi:type IV pilus assembly protein PilM